MKTKAIFVIAAAMVFSLASCEKNPGQQEETETKPVEAAGEVSGVWEAGSTVYVDGHIVVPEGESLTIEEGVTVIFSDAGVGVNHAAIEFSVDGSLYCLGTAENPVRLTVDESLRTPENTFEGLWGGIVAGAACERPQPRTVTTPPVTTPIPTSPPTMWTAATSSPTPPCATVGLTPST